MAADNTGIEAVPSTRSPERLKVERGTILFLQKRNERTRLDKGTDPIEAGMGGCPWRIAICVLIRRKCADPAARQLVHTFFQKYKSPEEVAKAPRGELELLLSPLNHSYFKARSVRALCKAWASNHWNSLYDLPYVGKEVMDAVFRYAT